MVHDVTREEGCTAANERERGVRGHNVRGEKNERYGEAGVSRHLVVCQFTRGYESDGTEIELALRLRHEQRWKNREG